MARYTAGPLNKVCQVESIKVWGNTEGWGLREYRGVHGLWYGLEEEWSQAP